MRSKSKFGAIGAPSVSPKFLQRSRISARVGVSPAVADVLAALAFGPERRDHAVMLAGITAERVGASIAGSR